MAQGQGRLTKGGGGGGRNKSKASQKRKVVRAKTATKGRKQPSNKSGRYCNSSAYRAQHETTKAINKKNESLIAAKAVGVGTKFFLADIADSGKQELTKQTQERDKKQQNKSSRATNRLKEQLRKLGGDKDS